MTDQEKAVQEKTMLVAHRFVRRLLSDAKVQIETWQNTHVNWPKSGKP